MFVCYVLVIISSSPFSTHQEFWGTRYSLERVGVIVQKKYGKKNVKRRTCSFIICAKKITCGF